MPAKISVFIAFGVWHIHCRKRATAMNHRTFWLLALMLLTLLLQPTQRGAVKDSFPDRISRSHQRGNMKRAERGISERCARSRETSSSRTAGPSTRNMAPAILTGCEIESIQTQRDTKANRSLNICCPLDDEIAQRIKPLAKPDSTKRPTSDTSDTPAVHPGKGRAARTVALQQSMPSS